MCVCACISFVSFDGFHISTVYLLFLQNNLSLKVSSKVKERADKERLTGGSLALNGTASIAPTSDGMAASSTPVSSKASKPSNPAAGKPGKSTKSHKRPKGEGDDPPKKKAKKAASRTAGKPAATLFEPEVCSII